MPPRHSIPRLLPLLLLGATLAAISVWACSVPVFRYALEHWAADAYQAVVFHRGPLTDAQRAMVNDLGSNGLAGRLHANISPKTVDLDANPTPELLELSRESDAARFPWLLVRTPRAARAAATVWSGPLDGKNIRQLLDSPARKEVVERLAQGQSAVWVMIESGDREKDAVAAKELETRLAFLAGALALPKPDPQDIVNGLISIAQEDLRLEFSVLRLALNNAEEQPFIQMLLGTEADLIASREPVVIPIFGRGRALYALVGAGIKRETIDQAATFLIGKCSCQVKEQNPGADLLFAADWIKLIKAHSAAAPDLPSLAELSKSSPVTVTISGDGGTGSSAEKSGAQSEPRLDPAKPLLGTLIAGGAIAALLIVAAAITFRRRK